MDLRILGTVLNAESRDGSARTFRWLHHGLLVLGLVAVVELTLQSTPIDRRLLVDLALLVTAFFAAEWLLRLLAAPQLAMPPGRPAARRRYLLSFLGLVDLASG